MTTTLAKLRGLGPFGLLLVAAAGLPLVGSAVLLAFTPEVEPRLRAAGFAGVVMFTLATALLSGLALMNTQVLALFAGYVFGFWTGFASVYVGIVGAALLAFAIATRISGPAFLAAIQASPRASAIHAALVRDPRDGLTTTALVRLSPVVPFAMVSVVLAAVGIRFAPFFAGTVLGVIPRTALVVFAGASLATFDPDAGPDRKVQIALAVVATAALFVFLGYAGKRALRRQIAANTTRPTDV